MHAGSHVSHLYCGILTNLVIREKQFSDEDWRGHFIFFLFPIGLHILTNAILFILTAIHCNKIKAEINQMQCSKDNDSQDKKSKFLADRAK